MPSREHRHTRIERPTERHITSQKVKKNSANDEITHVTTMSLGNSVRDMGIEDDLPDLPEVIEEPPRQLPPEQVWRPATLTRHVSGAKPRPKSEKGPFNRVSFNVRYTYPQQYHYSKNRYYSYRNALYDVPPCMKYFPQYGNMPLRQSCRYNPHDSLTFSRSHRIISAMLPHPKDSKRFSKKKKKTTTSTTTTATAATTFNTTDESNYNNNNYAYNNSLNGGDDQARNGADEDLARNGAFQYIHGDDDTSKDAENDDDDGGENDEVAESDKYEEEGFEDDDDDDDSSASSTSRSTSEEDQILYRRDASPRPDEVQEHLV